MFQTMQNTKEDILKDVCNYIFLVPIDLGMGECEAICKALWWPLSL